MRVLAVADEEDDVLTSRLAHAKPLPYDAVISCGDLRPGYLDYVATTTNAPLFYVRGNHDTDERGYASMGGIPLDGRVVRIGTLRVGGLDGSLSYRPDVVGYAEREMAVRACRLVVRAWLAGGLDVLVTHAPPRGYGDLEDLPHRGFACFNWLLMVLRPCLMLHGHVHRSYGMVAREHAHPSGTRIVNAFRWWEADVTADGAARGQG